ncbi:MAG: GcrA cell cycle regulator [Sphingomonadales bacterium]|jgi:GcrA cell cycle regulator|nr:GcrA cell cycle regulator [Sphingomonadales bacterium]MBK6491842.1 GcrA cell cycle regulator [Sphingomonadales bacterium]MBK6718748.1 GcrA cell cycle regulator [Sphingomonadales bacterium]MBK8860755.1 GcrA cell cycle regulator [Sphingomonadales bacterium]MBK9588533.1 GcrA cell cycle regulator [Sphingomonadales bacterium]
MSWTEERIEKLKSMWEKGMTASQIAEELGGVSRNAVIGKAHRLDLQSRPSPVKGADGEGSKPEPRKASAKPKTAPAEVTPRAAAPAPRAAAPVNTPQPVPTQPHAPTGAQLRSIGPGGFLRQGPGDQAPPATPAPPRRLVPAKIAPEYADKTGLLDLSDKICKWPLGHPGEPDFHFCGEKVNPGFPYCVQHCGHAYQAQMPRRDRRPPPPLPFGGPRVR